jgi:uncharacterized protein (DUF433 family)
VRGECRGNSEVRGNMMAQSLITRNDNILGGIPVFSGTRVPVKTLFDYLKANHPLDDFLDDFPTVTRQQAQQVLESVQLHLLQPDDEVVYEPAA